MDFGTCEPLIVQGGIDGFEGCLTVSNEDGDLLFYTNSDYVWNANHQIMQNGEINGFFYDPMGTSNFMSTNTQVAVAQNPADLNLYYIFTTDAQNVGFQEFTCTVVDMSQLGGLGAVSDSFILPAENIEERICTIPKSDGTGMWVVTHEYLNNKFLAFEVTAAGVNTTPVVSEVGDVHEFYPNSLNARGELKSNLEGNRLALVQDQMGGLIELFDFNQATGTVSNPIEVGLIDHGFGLSFSPNGQLLYVGTWVNFDPIDNRLWQFDISSNDPTTIENSMVELDVTSLFDAFGSIRNAPDGKMYIGRPNDYVSIIENPDTCGIGCNFISEGIFMGAGQGAWGLNCLWELPASPAPSASIDLGEDIDSCIPVTIGIEVDEATSYEWNTGETSSTITVDESGVYEVEVAIGSCTYTDEVEVSIGELTVDLGPDIDLCEGTSVALEVSNANVDVVWSNGSTATQIEIEQGGNYTVQITQGNCEASDEVNVFLLPSPEVDLGNDTLVCGVIELAVDVLSNESIEWSTGETSEAIEVDSSGIIQVVVSNEFCSSTDEIAIEVYGLVNEPAAYFEQICDGSLSTIQLPIGWNSWTLGDESGTDVLKLTSGEYIVELQSVCGVAEWEIVLESKDCECPVYFPNAFTPNLDGRNEVFTPIVSCEEVVVSFEIYSRWGECIYKSEGSLTEGWIGNVQGGEHYAPDGVYTYRAIINNPFVDGDKIVLGHVNLIR